MDIWEKGETKVKKKEDKSVLGEVLGDNVKAIFEEYKIW